jgi:hypothetical protein
MHLATGCLLQRYDHRTQGRHHSPMHAYQVVVIGTAE